MATALNFPVSGEVSSCISHASFAFCIAFTACFAIMKSTKENTDTEEHI